MFSLKMERRQEHSCALFFFMLCNFLLLLFGVINGCVWELHIMLLTDFKKASPEDKLSLFNSLLKGYQEEVDNLTKRAKFGENAFLNIYQKLYEAPDPYPALASIAVSSTISLRCPVLFIFMQNSYCLYHYDFSIIYIKFID